MNVKRQQNSGLQRKDHMKIEVWMDVQKATGTTLSEVHLTLLPP